MILFREVLLHGGQTGTQWRAFTKFLEPDEARRHVSCHCCVPASRGSCNCRNLLAGGGQCSMLYGGREPTERSARKNPTNLALRWYQLTVLTAFVSVWSPYCCSYTDNPSPWKPDLSRPVGWPSPWVQNCPVFFYHTCMYSTRFVFCMRRSPRWFSW